VLDVEAAVAAQLDTDDVDGNDDVSALTVAVDGFYGSIPSTTETCYSLKCFPQFDVDPPRMDNLILHISYFAFSLFSATKLNCIFYSRT